MKLGRVVCSNVWAPLAGWCSGWWHPRRLSRPRQRLRPPIRRRRSNLVAGPSLYETGKIGVVPESAPTPAPVPAELQWAGNSEKSIKPVAADIADAPPPRPPEGAIDPVRLTQEIQGNFETSGELQGRRRPRQAGRAVQGGRRPVAAALDHRTVGPDRLDGGGRGPAHRPRPHELRQGGDEPVVFHPAPRGRGPRRAAVHLPPRSLSVALAAARRPPGVPPGALSPSEGPGRVINGLATMSSVGGNTTVTEAASAASVDSQEATLLWLFPRSSAPVALRASASVS